MGRQGPIMVVAGTRSEKARYYLALQPGARELKQRAATAARLGYSKLKEVLARLCDKVYILQVGLYVLNTPILQR